MLLTLTLTTSACFASCDVWRFSLKCDRRRLTVEAVAGVSEVRRARVGCPCRWHEQPGQRCRSRSAGCCCCCFVAVAVCGQVRRRSMRHAHYCNADYHNISLLQYTTSSLFLHSARLPDIGLMQNTQFVIKSRQLKCRLLGEPLRLKKTTSWCINLRSFLKQPDTWLGIYEHVDWQSLKT